VQVFSADVADMSQMEAVIRQARERFGAIDGVIHAAGLPDGGMIQQRTRENSDPVLAPKVAGTLFIDRLLAGQKVDFFLLCSSLSSMLAPFGQVAYVSANAFLDAFAQGRAAQTGMPCISVNWGSWQEVGMAVEAVKDLQKVGPLSLQDEILPAEGAEAFERILSSGLSQVAVAVRDVALPLPAARDTEGVTGGPAAAGPAPFTGLIPVDELEQLLARMLADFLGLDRVGLDDNFFELGISSLDLVQISRKLKELVQKEVPVVTMFSFPTIRTLSQHLQGNAQAVPEPTDHQQAGELLEKSIALFKEI
jgi:NAD(P)-dependent dehydrogenase (short-subunit alcohol dehydrogenase family)/acyl carrier protein